MQLWVRRLGVVSAVAFSAGWLASAWGADVPTSAHAATRQATTQPVATQRATTHAVTIQPPAPPPATIQPAPVQPATTQPTTTQPITTEPGATQPVATLRSAYELWIEGEYDRAAEQYRLLRQEPDTAVQAAVGLGQCGLMTGDYAQALETLDAAGEQGQVSAVWHTLRAELLAREGACEQAIGHARRALEIDALHHRARTVLGQLLETIGQRDQAVEVYAYFDRLLTERLPESAEGITEAAKGFCRYSVLTGHPNLTQRTGHVLQEMLQVAYSRLDRSFWPARLAAADLLRSKYNLDEAAEDYQAALRINPNLPEAHVGLGLIALENWAFEEVELRVDAALQTNPRCVDALALRARSKIVERRYDDAIQACAQALEVNPNDLDALSLAAAAYRCKYDPEGSRRYEQRASAVNPRCAKLYGILGDALSGLRQYGDSESAYLKSIEYEPTDPNPRTELGLMYMQWGKETEARQVLEAAWKLDQFNERTDNTLQLLEKLQAFARLETDHFTIHYDEVEDWPVATYLARTAEETYADVCGDYGAELAQRTMVEVFPTHRDFGVRITGKPWIHTVGACTGWVIALDSPRPGPGTLGPYHYARVLRHEFTHTVTLALTHNRISHWYTEGLAVAGEDQPRSFAWKQLLADAVRRGRLFTLESIDWGFVRPQRPNDRELAYAQSEWMVEYIIHEYGYDALTRLLEAYDAAKPQARVFGDVLGVEPAKFDEQFAAWARRQAEGWGGDLTPPEDPIELRVKAEAAESDAVLLGRLAKAELDAGNLPEATEAAGQALDLDQNEVNALRVMVEAYNLAAAHASTPQEREQVYEQARPHLQRLAQADPDDWVAPQLLGGLALGDQQYDEAERWFKRVKRLCPENPAGYRGLTAIYLQRGQIDEAQPVLFELARLEEHDAAVPADLAAIFARKDRLGEARYWYRQALYIDPFDPMTHRKQAEVLMRSGDTREALTEYEVLCRLEPGRSQNFADAAFAYRKMADAENARRCAAKAVELDPASPARTLLNVPAGE